MSNGYVGGMKPTDVGTITAKKLRSMVEYDPKTGIMRTNGGSTGWVLKPSQRRTPYRYITVDGRSYSAARLAFLYMTDHWPEDEMDHINGDPLDNRWANLREATRAQNEANKNRANRNSKTGVRGVWAARKGRGFEASVMRNRVRKWFGPFQTVEEAAAAYKEAKQCN